MSHKTIRRKSTLKKLNSINDQLSPLEKTFCIRQCIYFIPSTKNSNRCCCGLPMTKHETDAKNIPPSPNHRSQAKWQPSQHSRLTPTNAYGVIEFHKSGSLKKSQYVRLAHDTSSEAVLQLMTKGWHLQLPKLLISVHGGSKNFSLEPKLKRAFRKGLQRAAQTTSAWIITSGIHSGVVRHVGDVLGERSASKKNDIPAIGIAPWGVVEMKEQLVGLQNISNLPSVSSKGSFALDSNHTHFLLADNGTSNRFGADTFLRRRLEKYISQQKINRVINQKVPVVCLVVEGGPFTIHMVLDYVSDDPPVPVVVIDGSGRAADLLAFTYKCTNEDGVLIQEAYSELFEAIQTNFDFDENKSEYLINQLLECVKKKELITVVQLSDSDGQELDTAIVSSLLKDKHSSASDQLNWTLTWGRDDIAQNQVFNEGVQWAPGVLEQAMFDALLGDKVEFVQLLMDKGVNMRTFLTFPRLEQLYNTKEGPSNMLRHFVRSVRKTIRSKHDSFITLPDIGVLIEKLMSGTFQSLYCQKKFRCLYHTVIKQNSEKPLEANHLTNYLDLPFNHLLIWAVLMKRHKMALLMWQHGEEAMAKALIACKLNQAMADEVAEDDLDWEIYDELYKNSETFQKLALQLLKECHNIDEFYAQQLLTYELQNWSKKTCLELASNCKHLKFIAHNCCQSLLSQMWLGGLQVRQNRNLKIILGILLPPTILFLEFKSKEELQYTPQTIEEYIQDMQINNTEDMDQELVSDTEDIEAYCYAGIEESSPQDEAHLNVTFSNSNLSEITLEKKNETKKKFHSLKLGRKICKFYKAPITKFWSHTLFYLVFLGLFIYMVLVKMDHKTPNFAEWFVIFTIFTIAIERIRDLMASEIPDLRKKWKEWVNNKWNVWDMIAIGTFYLALILRFNEQSFSMGRFLYCVNIIFWIVRLLDIFSVHVYLGPYVLTIKKMIKDVCYFFMVLMVMAIAFGVSRQAILNPNAPPAWNLLIDVVYEPYFMVFGELFTEHINPGCNTGSASCTTGAWLSPILMSIYLLMTYMLLVNLLIAKFNHTFAEVERISNKLWKYHRYSLIMRYERAPLLPPPLIIFNHLYSLEKFIYNFYKKKKIHWDKGLKLFLMPEDLEKLFYFEEECVNSYLQQSDNLINGNQSDQLTSISDRTNQISNRLDEQCERDENIWNSQQTLELRMATLEEIVKDSVSMMQNLAKIVMECADPANPSRPSSPKPNFPVFANSGPTSPTPEYLMVNNMLVRRPSITSRKIIPQNHFLEKQTLEKNNQEEEALSSSNHLSPILPKKYPRRLSMPIKVGGSLLSSGIAQHLEKIRLRRPSLLISKSTLSHLTNPTSTIITPISNILTSDKEISSTFCEQESSDEIEQEAGISKKVHFFTKQSSENLSKELAEHHLENEFILTKPPGRSSLLQSDANQDGRCSPHHVRFNENSAQIQDSFEQLTMSEILDPESKKYSTNEKSLPEILIDASSLVINEDYYNSDMKEISYLNQMQTDSNI